MHLKEKYGSLEALQGKKIVMSWAYSPSYGKPLSVPQGIIALLSRFGMNIELAYPEGYELLPGIVSLAEKNSIESGGSFTISNSMEESMKDADIVYPKSWAPFHIMQLRTQLLKDGDKSGLKDLEELCLSNNAKFTDWEYNERIMRHTKNGNALYMHCLPADISGVSCKKGEVSSSTFEKYRLMTYREAGFKPYIIAAMMFTNKFANPSETLRKILERDRRRISF
jgi:knotted carbamoyltransferase YgeW